MEENGEGEEGTGEGVEEGKSQEVGGTWEAHWCVWVVDVRV